MLVSKRLCSTKPVKPTLGKKRETINVFVELHIVYLVFSGSVSTKYDLEVVARSFSAKKS